jgi:hypothetical protein
MLTAKLIGLGKLEQTRAKAGYQGATDSANDKTGAALRNNGVAEESSADIIIR